MADAFDPAEFAAFKASSRDQWPVTPVPGDKFDADEFAASKKQAAKLPDAPWVKSAPPDGFLLNKPGNPPDGFVIDQRPGADLPDAPWVKKKPADLSWSEVGSQALQNAPRSAGQFASDIAQPFIHPIDTISNIGDAGHGLAQKLGLASGEEDVPAADAVGHFFKNRYGSIEGFKHALAEDPVGVAGDFSMLLTGGETALARAPALIGKAGDVAGAVGRAVDPLNAVFAAANVAKKAGAEIAGITTGAGSQPIKVAAQAGYDGGASGRAFRENLTGAAPLEDAVNDARSAVRQIRQERGTAYRDQMAQIGADQTVLDFQKIDDAVAKSQGIKTYKGQNLSPSTGAVRSAMEDAIADWKNLDPQEFHTPEGLDALKQKLGDLRDATEERTPSRVAADQIYNAVRQTIIDQAPDYAKTMKGYEAASNQIREIEKTLSLNPNATIDTALRKLQSTLRDNVNTSFGRRTELAKYLAENGAPHLMEKLAGQALHSWAPRGLARLGTMEAIPAAVGALGAGVHGAGIGVLGTLPLTSPRLMGNVAYGAGRMAKAARPLSVLPRPARLIGRLNDATIP